MKHSTLLIFTCLIALFSLKANAGVAETVFELPDDLGTATLYSSQTPDENKPAIIVVHEWWGLNDYVKGRAKMLAEEGYTAIAVDMYGHGKVAEHPNDAKGFMDAALENPGKMNARFNAAKDILKAQEHVNSERLYAMGYCFGGAVVLNQARMGNDLAG
ncbi:MAG: alpha/beta fold hydrolase, partial [Pseudomonadota bacterium]